MLRSFVLLGLAAGWLCVCSAVAAEPAGLRFVPAENSIYPFDTGVVRGSLRADGKVQGISSLIHAETGVELLHSVGALSYYRIFSTATRYGDAARGWPTENTLNADGSLQLRFPPADEHPLDMTAVFRWSAADTLDVETTVTPQQDFPKFEVFLSSYFGVETRGFVYVRPNLFAAGPPSLLAADVNPLVDGSYLFFPRDRESVLTIFDGRWDRPPSPVQWSVTRWIAGPLAVRRDEKNGLAVVLMAPPQDCFAIAAPYNKTPPDGPSGHASIYFSLFGGDVKTGETVRARTRMIVGRDLSDDEIIRRYEAYVNGKSE